MTNEHGLSNPTTRGGTAYLQPQHATHPAQDCMHGVRERTRCRSQARIHRGAKLPAASTHISANDASSTHTAWVGVHTGSACASAYVTVLHAVEGSAPQAGTSAPEGDTLTTRACTVAFVDTADAHDPVACDSSASTSPADALATVTVTLRPTATPSAGVAAATASQTTHTALTIVDPPMMNGHTCASASTHANTAPSHGTPNGRVRAETWQQSHADKHLLLSVSWLLNLLCFVAVSCLAVPWDVTTPNRQSLAACRVNVRQCWTWRGPSTRTCAVPKVEAMPAEASTPPTCCTKNWTPAAAASADAPTKPASSKARLRSPPIA